MVSENVIWNLALLPIFPPSGPKHKKIMQICIPLYTAPFVPRYRHLGPPSWGGLAPHSAAPTLICVEFRGFPPPPPYAPDLS